MSRYKETIAVITDSGSAKMVSIMKTKTSSRCLRLTPVYYGCRDVLASLVSS